MKNKDKFFLKMFFLITLLVITVVIIFACSIYSYSSRKIKESMADVSAKLVGQIETFVDTYVFHNAEVFASKNFITINDDMKISKIYGNERLEQSFIYKYYKELALLVAAEDFIRGVHVYIPHRNIIISSDAICYLDDDNKPTSFETEKKHIFENALKDDKKWLTTYTNSNSENVITMIVRYSPHNEKIPIAIVAVDIPEENVQRIFSKFSNNSSSKFEILDEKGKMVSNSDKALLFDDASNEKYVREILKTDVPTGCFISEINGSEKLVSYIKSDYNSWIYLSVQDIGVVFESNRFLLVFTLFISFLALLIGFLGAYFVSNNYYFSMRDIVALVSGENNEDGQNDVYAFLKNSIHGMSDDLKKYNKMKADIVPIAKNNLAFSLTHDHNLNIEYLHKQYEIIGMDKDIFKAFAVCQCNFNNSDNDKNAYFEYGFMEYIYSLNSANRMFLCCDGGIQPITVVICARSHEDINLSDFTEELKRTFNELKIDDYMIFVDEVVNSVYDIAESYSRLISMEKYRFVLGETQVFEYQSFVKRESSDEKLDEEALFERLSEKMDAKNADDTIRCIADMITNLKEGNYSYNYIQDFLLQFIRYISEYMQKNEIELKKIGIDNEYIYQEYRSAQTIDAIMGVIQDVCVNIVLFYSKNAGSNEISKKVISFVKKLPDEEMKNVTLMFVADKLLLSQAYISRNFKSETGKKFLDWLTDEKLERSAKILKDRGMKIKDICNMMGYSNSNYFIRKFKDKYGITPKQYQSKS